jgi:hypothetical protein
VQVHGAEAGRNGAGCTPLRAERLLSDINITFPWPVLLIVFMLAGWPGFLLGAAAGALAWRAHRVTGGLIGAVVLDYTWAFLRFDVGGWFG